MDPSVFHAPSGCWGREKGEREGTTNPLVLFSVKTPYLAEKICESDRQIREKNLTNHRIVSLPSLFPERKNIAVENLDTSSKVCLLERNTVTRFFYAVTARFGIL